MANKLLKLYQDIIESLDYHVTEEGVIKSEVDGVPQLINGLPLVLPTKEHIDTLVAMEDGAYNVTKILYNPFCEDAVKSDSKTLTVTKQIVDSQLLYLTYVVGSQLIAFASNEELHEQASLELSGFMSTLNPGKKHKTKQICDEGTEKIWTTLFKTTSTAGQGKSFIHIFLKKGGSVDGVKYNRLASARFPVYKELEGAHSKDKPYGLNFRNKDITVIRAIFEFIFKGLNTGRKYYYGSNDGSAPGFIALMTLYHNLMSRLLDMHKMLKFVDKDLYDAVQFELKFDPSVFDNLQAYAGELSMIPDDSDVARMQETGSTTPSQQTERLGRPQVGNVEINQPNHNQNTMPQQQQHEQTRPQMSEDDEFLSQFLAGVNRDTFNNGFGGMPMNGMPQSYQQPYPQQQMAYPPQQMNYPPQQYNYNTPPPGFNGYQQDIPQEQLVPAYSAVGNQYSVQRY